MSAIDDAAMAASMFAADPAGTGGVCLRSPVHPAREEWLRILRDLLPADAPMRRVPFNIPDGRLLGGLDLVATLKANRPIAERGVLAEADGGVVVLSMAERLSANTVARVNAVIDAGEVVVSREGVSIRNRCAFGVVALDEGMSDDEHAPAALLDHCAFLLDFNGFDLKTPMIPAHTDEEVAAARQLLPAVQSGGDMIQALCATALALGVWSPRVSLLALRAARCAAALAGRTELLEEDAVLAGRLVLAPRATIAPQSQPQQQPEAEPPPDAGPDSAAAPPSNTAPPENPADADQPVEINQQQLEEMVLAATRSAIPAGLLARLHSSATERTRQSRSAGRAGALKNSGGRGRPCGVLAGMPRGSARLNVIETLRAAAPWQGLRGRSGAATGTKSGSARIRVSPEDFRVTRYKQRAQTITIFVVDASGSSALNRLAEAKGAVELLLADCYIRRDQVAVIAFRGRTAQVLLPPTRSLVRAKRSLAGLPGGGGTPMTAAIEAAVAMADCARRRGETPTLVMLTDGRANVSRDGSPGREAAHAQALLAAGAVRGHRITTLFVDTSPRPQVLARELADRMNAHYLPLPFANARSLSAAVRAVTTGN